MGVLSAGSCDDYFARVMLRSSCIDANTEIVFVPLGRAYGDIRCFYPRQVQGVAQVDAGFLVEPFVSLGEELGLVCILATARDYYPHYQWGVIVASADALASRFGAQVFRLPRGVFRRALLRVLERWELDARLDRQGMQSCLRLQKASGA